jgi:hypothetical protein
VSPRTVVAVAEQLVATSGQIPLATNTTHFKNHWNHLLMWFRMQKTYSDGGVDYDWLVLIWSRRHQLWTRF